MGQLIGRAVLVTASQPFANLSRRAIANLWQAFNDIADGFGISKDEFEEICCELKEEWNASRMAVSAKATLLFVELDTDRNGLIDALEFASTVAALSGMKLREILEFILSIYDFDGSQLLSVDEVTLAFKSLSTGLCKLTTIPAPREEAIEQLVSQLFMDCAGNDHADHVRLRINVLAESLLSQPDIRSWFSFFGNPTYASEKASVFKMLPADCDHEGENIPQPRTEDQTLAIAWNLLSKFDGPTYFAKTGETWRTFTEKLEPMIYHDAVVRTLPPETSLSLEWIYGYQSERCRNNVRYNVDGDVVYNVGRFAIVYNFSRHEQRVFTGHDEEIISLAVHPAGEFCATGDVGPKPRILVWHTVTREIVFVDRAFHKHGVVHLTFSEDGKLLGSVGNDAFHTLAVYRWADNTVLFTSYVDRGPCLAVAFLHDNSVVASGDSYIFFWTRAGDTFEKRRGNFSSFSPPQPVTTLCAVQGAGGDSIVAGTVSGRLSLWVDRNCVRHVAAHQGAINALYSSPQGLLSGGKDNRIRLWTSKLEPGATFDMSGFGNNPSIRSLCLSVDGRAILLGTKGGNVFEISSVDGSDVRGGPFASGHCMGNLRAVMSHPSKHQFLTAGDDCKVRIWDTISRTLLKVAHFDAEVRAAAYSPLGDCIAVGFGMIVRDPFGSPNLPQTDDKLSAEELQEELQLKAGAFAIVSEDDLTRLFEGKDSKSPVSVIAYSPAGDTLAVGTDDGSIFLYAVPDEYELIGKCVRHTAPIISLDFSLDGEWLRSNSTDMDVFFWSTDDASVQTNMQSMRDVEWSTFTSPYTWHTQGAHSSHYMTDIVTTTGAPLPVKEADYFVAGTKYGYLRVHNFPSVPEEGKVPPSHTYPAHANAVLAVRNSFDGHLLISGGKDDRAVLQWRVMRFPEEPVPDDGMTLEFAEAKDGAAGGKAPMSMDEMRFGAAGAGLRKVQLAGAVSTKDKPKDEESSQGSGQPENADMAIEIKMGDKLLEEFMPGKSCALTAAQMNAAEVPMASNLDNVPKVNVWLESVVAPSNPPPPRLEVPDATLRLEYSYGYRCQEMRNSVRYNSNSELVYICNTIGVTVNRGSKVQNFYQHHTDAITSFTVSSDGLLAATGQWGTSPFVSVWDAVTCDVLSSLRDIHVDGVSALAFSPDTTLLAAVSLDPQNTVSVYDWRNDVLVSRMLGGPLRIFGLSFLHDNHSLMTVGDQHIRFWNGVETALPTCVRPVLGDKGTYAQHFYNCCYFQGCPIVACQDGNLYLFEEEFMRRPVQAHAGPINSMDVNQQGDMLVTGGKDGIVRVWNNSVEMVREVDVKALVKTLSVKVRAVAFDPSGRNVAIATRGAEIFEVNLQDGTMIGKVLVNGHGCRSLWGLAVHPTKDEFATCGDDASVRVWNSKNYELMRTIPLEIGARAIGYSANGKHLVVGFGTSKKLKGKQALKEGSYTVINCKDMKILHEGKDSNESIRVVQFNSQNTYMCLGAEDGNIYLYNPKDKYVFVRTINAHKAPIMSVDFSVDGGYLMSVDSTRRITYSEAITGAQLNSPVSLRDEKWSSFSSTVGWPVMGMWMIQSDETEPTACQRSHNNSLVACGDNAGRLVVAHAPCFHRPRFLSATGHAGPIAAIGWAAGDGRVFTIGAKDHVILQWKVVYDEARESGDEGGKSCEDSEVERDGGKGLKAVARKRGAHTGVTTKLLPKDAAAGALALVPAGESKKDGGPPPVLPPWTGSICAPSKAATESAAAPTDQLELDYVHGVRVEDTRQTLRYNEDGNTVHVTAAVAVVYDRSTLQQRVYGGHKNPVISLDVDPSGKMAATGELHDNPEVHIWDARTTKHIATVKNIHRNGVISLSFSRTAEYLATLGQDSGYSLVVLRSPSRRWADSYVAYSTSVWHKKMLWVLYVDSNPFPVVVGGSYGVVFFRQAGKGAERTKGTFGKKRRIQPVTCAAVGQVMPDTVNGGLQTSIVTGTITGDLLLWFNQKVDQSVPAHQAPIFGVSKVGDGYASGGKDGLIKMWDRNLQCLHTYNLETFSPAPFGPRIVHALACNVNSGANRLLVGTKGGTVYEVSVPTKSSVMLLESHSVNELYGLCTNPVNPDEYVTVGDDGYLRVWSISLSACVRRTHLEFAARAVAYSLDASYLVVGIGGDPKINTKDGAFMVLDSKSLDLIMEDRRAKMYITDIKFHHGGPNVGGAPGNNEGVGAIFVMLSVDGKVYVHDARTYKLLRSVSLPTRSRALTRVDFSEDGTMLRVATDGDELIHFKTIDGEVIPTPNAVRDVAWKTRTCPNTWLTQGLTRPHHEGIKLLEVAVNPQKDLVAASYQNGDIRVFRYPQTINNTKAEFYEIPGAATYASKMQFTCDGKYLIALDVFTRTVLQYKLYAAKG